MLFSSPTLMVAMTHMKDHSTIASGGLLNGQ